VRSRVHPPIFNESRLFVNGMPAAEQETERLYILCQGCYIEPAIFRFPGP
jgi:hypothetical protein